MNKIFVTKPFLPDFDEFVSVIKVIWDNNWLTNMGPLHNELEVRLMDYLNVSNISLFTNGHLALEIALKGLKLRGEVITTPFTFASTTHAIVNCGLTPVFCDIKPGDFTIDEEQIEVLITEDTCAILPVHVYGFPCNVKKLDIIARRHGLKLIYDAAHAFSVETEGAPIGTFGDVSMFSFHATKLFHTIEGGALVYANGELKQRFDMLKNFGIAGPESVDDVGSNAKMNEMQAAMGIVNLRHIQEIVEARRRIILRYQENLCGVKGLWIPNFSKDVKHNYAYLPVLFDKMTFGKSRDEVFNELATNNIFARKYFYPLITDYKCYQGRFSNQHCPVAAETAASVMTLPIYHDLSTNDIDRICQVIIG